MRYFELEDYVSMPGRWCVGEILLPDGTEPLLNGGVRLDDPRPLRAEVYHPPLGHDLRHAFGPKRETIILRPRIGGVASDDESLAKQNLAFEAGITIITLLTPGPLDDIAANGLRVGARGIVRGGAGVVRTGQAGELAVRRVVDIGPKKVKRLKSTARRRRSSSSG